MPNSHRLFPIARAAKMASALASALLLLCAPSVNAAPIHYTIDFTAGTGAVPTATFEYDGGQPVNQQFSNFTVTWMSHVFDMTSAANSFTFRTDAGFFATSCASTPSVNDAFEMLTHAPCVASQATLYQWQVITGLGLNYFAFMANSGTGTSAATDSFSTTISGNFTDGGTYGNGYIARPDVIQHSIPGPATITLVGLALAGLNAGRRRTVG